MTDLEWHENKKLRRMEVAAPRMLEALQFLRREYARPSSDVLLTDEAKDRIDAAIKAATDEP
jgi:hypothetical protein